MDAGSDHTVQGKYGTIRVKGETPVNEHPSPLWRYIRLSDYSSPVQPTQETVRKNVRGLWKRLLGTSEPEEQIVVHKDLRLVPQSLLDRAVSAPDWNDAVLSLDDALKKWLDNDPSEPSIQVVVGAPYSHVSHIITRWADARQWRLIEMPVPEQILEGDDGWLSHQLERGDETPVVLPRLERCYLRRHDGLEMIHLLFDRLWSSRRRCLIGCNSWAWAYLSKALHIDSPLPPPLTLEAFDHEHLQRWFQTLAVPSSEDRVFAFRQVNNNKFVLTPTGIEKQHGSEEQSKGTGNDKEDLSFEVTDFLQYVAAYSRGIPGVALEVWRHSLRFVPEEEVREKAKEMGHSDNVDILWVRPWNQISLPTLPGVVELPQLFGLHTLLLHDGLPESLLPELLPFSSRELLGELHRLRMTGVLEREQGIWRVTPLGYPAVRRLIEVEGYLVDAL